MSDRRTPALIIVGGFPGSGKTAIAGRLASEFGLPCLSSDTVGKTIRAQEAFQGSSHDASVLGYAVIWRLCDDFLAAGASVIVDTNMHWEVAWQEADGVRDRHPDAAYLPIILRCPYDVCVERTRSRYVEQPGLHADPERFVSDELEERWRYIQQLERPDATSVDANRPISEVYADVREVVTSADGSAGLTGRLAELP
jgi:predicted kinase